MAEGVVDLVDAVDRVDKMHALDQETTTNRSPPITKSTSNVQMDLPSTKQFRRGKTMEETTADPSSAFVFSGGPQVMSKLIVSPSNIQMSRGE